MIPRRAWGARRWGWLLLLACGSACLWGGGRSGPAWLAASAVFWGLAWLSAGPVLSGQGIGAWAAWSGWSAVCVLLSEEPLMGLHAWCRGATCVLVLALGRSWWRSAHRRAWVFGLAGLSIALGILPGAGPAFGLGSLLDWPSGSYAAVLSTAAAAACAGAWLGETPRSGAWRWGFGAASVLCLGLWALQLHSRSLDWSWWSAALRASWDRPVSGWGPGLLLRALLRRPPLGPGEARVWAWPGEAPPEPLAALAETGWIGLALYAWALAANAPSGFKGLGWERRAAAAAFYALTVESCLGGALRLPALQLAYFASMAAARGPLPEGAEWPRPEERGKRWPLPRWLCALGLALCAAGWSARELARSEDPAAALRVAPGDPSIRMRLALAALASSPPDPALALLHVEAAIRADPFNAEYLSRRDELLARSRGD